MCRTCGVSPATAASANRLPKPICAEVEKSQTEIRDFSRLKEREIRVPNGRGRPFYIVARAIPPAVGTGGVESGRRKRGTG